MRFFPIQATASSMKKGEKTGVEVNVPKSVDYKTLVGNTIVSCLTVMLDKKQISRNFNAKSNT